MSIDLAFSLAQRGLANDDQETLLSAIHLFEAIQVSAADPKTKELIARNIGELKESALPVRAANL